MTTTSTSSSPVLDKEIGIYSKTPTTFQATHEREGEESVRSITNNNQNLNTTTQPQQDTPYLSPTVPSLIQQPFLCSNYANVQENENIQVIRLKYESAGGISYSICFHVNCQHHIQSFKKSRL